jgi:alkylation response protein AidB-like acyl-CoA dehydrogenase
MNFELSDEQRMLHDSLSRLLADRYSFELRNRYRALPGGYDQAIWQAYAEMGLTALNVPEAHGGLGAGPEETFIVMTELGKALCVEPFLQTCVVAPELLKAANEDQAAPLLERIAAGEVIVAFAHQEPAHWSGEADGVSARARAADGDGWQLDGVKSPVRHGAQAEVLIVSAQADGDVGLFLVDGAAATRRDFETQDGMRAAEVVLEGTSAQRLAGGIAAVEAIACAQAAGLAAICAEAVGCMDKALVLTGEFLKAREQFGRAIGSFQALQHTAADMVIEVEQARSMALYAAMMAGADDPSQRDAALSAAKVQVCRSARAVGQAAVQLHGGVGMTMEYAIGHYFKRLTMIELEFGGLDFHLDRLSALGGLDS